MPDVPLVVAGERDSLTEIKAYIKSHHLEMPSEITLTEKMRVRCRGQVVRSNSSSSGSKRGIAVHLSGYEFLPQAESLAEMPGCFGRISALHQHPREEDGQPDASARARGATPS